MSIFLHQNDLPDSVDFSAVKSVAVDTETTGLNIGRDRLCVVQLSFGNDEAHLVQFRGPGNRYDLAKFKRLF